MGITKEGSESKFGRFEKEGVPDLETAIEECTNLLLDQGLSGTSDEPEVTIVLKNNIIDRNDRKFNMIVYIGDSTKEVTDDLNSRG